ncbi:hypothetical protein NDU88_002673 [Pleurodeles waltl]|uniref:Uncharacterized protein n=1 Tax=Pleurodeles waltl TaxID=8319 RepID=A0AAV7LGI9_PLEWA|nr:hypothetical protein NDU88_002673 [Pleurodeles waltl]
MGRVPGRLGGALKRPKNTGGGVHEKGDLTGNQREETNGDEHPDCQILENGTRRQQLVEAGHALESVAYPDMLVEQWEEVEEESKDVLSYVKELKETLHEVWESAQTCLKNA